MFTLSMQEQRLTVMAAAHKSGDTNAGSLAYLED